MSWPDRLYALELVGMTPELARAIAHELAIQFTRPLRELQHAVPEMPVRTLADVLGLGACVAVAMRPYYKSGGESEFQAQLRRLAKTFELGRMDTLALEEQLFNAIFDGKESADELTQQVHFVVGLLSSPARLHEVFDAVRNDLLPPRGVGKPATLLAGTEPFLATLSASLKSIAEKFLRIREMFPSKTVEEVIDLMASDHLQDASALAQRVGVLKQTLSNPEFVSRKTSSSRVQYLADALAGADFQISPTYAHQRAERGRKDLNPIADEEK